MKKIRTITLSGIVFCISIFSSAQTTLFYDDFSTNYDNWTTYSITGDIQWHLSGDDGIDGGKCARIYAVGSTQNNDDWLVSNPINTSEVPGVRITFQYWYYGDNLVPKFYYTNNINEDFEQTEWTEISPAKELTPGNWNEVRIEIENPEDNFVFAFRYESSIGDWDKIMIDNFSVDSFEPVVFEKVGETDHFEYYTNIENEENFADEIKDVLEEKYSEYCEFWNIPGLEDFMDENIKTKIYYTNKDEISLAKEEMLEIKSGYFDKDEYSIYLSPLNTDGQLNYYDDLKGLALHTFAGYAITHRTIRDDWIDSFPLYFIEGFGLYEQGYRPDRDSIISFRAKHPQDLTHEDLVGMQNNNTSEKDIMVSYVEGQILCSEGYNCFAPFSSYTYIWNNYLSHFYDTTNVVQIKKYGESPYFDIYCSSRDTMYIDSIEVWLERTRQFYVDSFQMQINNRNHIVVCHDFETTADLTPWGGFNGGCGQLNISPQNYYDGIKGYPWLLAHEFGHVFNDLMYYDFPIGFFHEGMANFSGYKQCGEDWSSSRRKINTVFNFYLEKYGREPKLEEFINDPDADEPDFEGINPYFFGFEFIRYLTFKNSLVEIKKFFSNGLDYSQLNESYEEIESGYKTYLKSMVGLETNVEELKEAPYLISIDQNSIRIKNNKAGNQNISLQIFNLSGQQILNGSFQLLQGESHSLVLNLSRTKELLLVKLYDGEKSYSKKILTGFN